MLWIEIESDETEDSLTTDDQYVNEQLADPFCSGIAEEEQGKQL